MGTPLTYEGLFDALRREKSRDELQHLDPEFYEMVGDLLASRQDAIRSSQASHGFESASAQRAQIEYQNLRKLFRELYDRRERKVLTLALHRTRTDAAVIETDALLVPERRLFDDAVRLLVSTRSEALSLSEPRRMMSASVDDGAPDVEPEPFSREISHSSSSDSASVLDVDASTPQDEVSVRFLAHVPKFVGKNLKVFGPFEEGSSEMLPSDVAQILVKKGRAEVLE